ncbi:protein DpdI [Ferrimonas senticii]|uniref:protein DpdI n=1 Tax=Ferrimonas senticii TaxID=394566 RepID=UPI00040B612F|nr:protein DpdI [Ferrimonas senticii]
MTNLQEQLNELTKQLDANQSAADVKQKLAVYDTIADRVQSIAKPLKKARLTQQALKSVDPKLAQLPDWDDEQLAQLKTSAASITALAAEWNQGADLTQGEQLNKTISSCKASLKQVDEVQDATWRRWTQALKEKGLVQEQMLEMQRNLTSVKEVVAQYRRRADELNGLLQSTPTDVAVVERCQALAQQLVELQQQMEFNIPEDVEKFLNEFSLNAKPTLAMLTPEVLAWLTSKGMLSNFQLKQVL